MRKNYLGMILIFIVATLFFLKLSTAFSQIKVDSEYDEALKEYENKEFEKVIQTLSQTVESNADNFLYHGLLGNAYLKLNKKNEAKKHYDRAINLGINDPLVYYNRAVLEEDYEYQKILFYKSIEFEPLNIVTNTVLFTILQSKAIDEYNQNNKEAAIKLIEEAKIVINRYLENNKELLINQNEETQMINLLFSSRLKQLEETEILWNKK